VIEIVFILRSQVCPTRVCSDLRSKFVALLMSVLSAGEEVNISDSKKVKSFSHEPIALQISLSVL